jgi:G:T-mismatch repair DNA endonuclease (very short patch repair protein)
MKICVKCEKYNCHKEICWRCKQKEKYKIRIKIKCKYCEKKVETSKSKKNIYKKKGGIVCKECWTRHLSIKMKEYNNSLTPKQRKEHGSRASKCADHSKGVQKQWDTIRKDPEKWKKMQQQRSISAKKMWAGFSEEQRNKILGSWLKNKPRSKVSDNLKKLMIKNNLYNGFESEEAFHGFFPDEKNDELKIIVEMYGDLYHCNPHKYKNPDLYLKTIGRTVGDQWKRDRRRLACFYKHGYTVIIVWERDFYNNANKQIERIRDEIDKKRKAD